jgi:GT2 family glycosyltransferase
MRWLEQGIQFDYRSIDGTEASWGHLYSANVSIKLALLERVGGFDEERLPYLYEDLDWGYRASAHGLRLLYNRRAVVDHLRHDVTPEHWKRRMRAVAAAERRFVSLHPEVEPHLYTRLRGAAASPPGRGRGARLARFVPPWVPWLGPRVWDAAALHWQQQLAPAFLEGWEAAG